MPQPCRLRSGRRRWRGDHRQSCAQRPDVAESVPPKRLIGEASIKGLGGASGQPWSYQQLMGKLDDTVLGEGASNFVSGAHNSFYADKGYHGDQPPPGKHPHSGY